MKNNLRLYLWGALALLLFYDYQAWMRDYAPPPALNSSAQQHGASGAPASDLGNRIPQLPSAGTAAGGAAATAPPTATAGAATASADATTAAPGAAALAASAAAAAPVVHVRTDVLDVDISTQGGTLERADLLAYPEVKGEATPVRLEDHNDAQSLYLLQSGLTGPPPG
jgi:YidC/Oxa1 family membrane protein insertase